MSRLEHFVAGGGLPMENGLYYRSHPIGRPFSRADATTQPLNRPDHPDFQPGGSLAHLHEQKQGYSAFWNPHHVEQYHEQMGWSMKGRRVVAFRGTAVGEGSDGEPRVMPHTDAPVATLSARQFADHLDRTPNGYGRWDDHTWGDGPEGMQVDDGYRTISGGR